MKHTRRRILLGAGALLAGGYAYHRGLRYPRLSLAPAQLSDKLSAQGASLELADLIVTQAEPISLRAIAPEPRLKLTVKPGKYSIDVGNLSPHAKLEIKQSGTTSIDETASGLTRKLQIVANQSIELSLSWYVPYERGFSFAIIGDTGAGDELDWALNRAAQLDALFLLHLGDFNYGPGEYPLAIKKFADSPLPCYVSIGNHDFHHHGLIYQRFRSDIGPMNHAFSIAGTQFINIDTAADFFPASGGLRGQLFANLKDDSNHYSDRVFFTHRPLRDPRPHDDHVVGSIGEIEWLGEQINSLGSHTLLTGHVHHSAELEVNGIKQWTVGEGLGHEDLVLQRPVAQMLMGQVEPGAATTFRWVDLDLPWSMHTSPTHTSKLIRDHRQRQLEWYRTLISVS